MWRLKDHAEGADKKVNAFKIKEKLEALKIKIKEIKTIEVGINQYDSKQSCDIVLHSEFETWDDLDLYKKHPEHIRVAEFIGKARTERLFVDYETKSI